MAARARGRASEDRVAAAPPRLAACRQILQRAWLHRGPLALLLWPVSLVFRTLVGTRRALYRAGVFAAHRMPVPVIVVGNVVAGGGGKTPVTLAVVAHLQRRGFHPGVISRGYGRSGEGCGSVLPGSAAHEVGDEPLLIRRRSGVPVAVASRRVEAAKWLLRHHPEVDVVVADDGLQHWALQRDVEICVFDATGVGNGWLLPAGPLREPWPRPTNLVLQSGAPSIARAHLLRRQLEDHAVRADGSLLPLAQLAGAQPPGAAPLCAVAGTAHPEEFFRMLRDRGLLLDRVVALPDHAPLEAYRTAAGDGHLVLCTEKDAVKLWQHFPLALAVPLRAEPAAEFWAALDVLLPTRGQAARLSSPHGHPPA